MTGSKQKEFEEQQAIGPRPLVRGALWCVGVLVVTATVFYAAFWLPYHDPAADPPHPLPILPEAPAAEPAQGYEWVDRDAGIVRIPVEDAMRITAERLPMRNRAADERCPERPTDAGSGRAPRPVAKP